jgi:hypothetical protein
MAIQVGIPEAAWNFLSDMVDNVVDMNDSRKEVVILAHKDGLYNGENLIDEEAVSWVSTAFTSRGHRVSILWVDDPQRVHEWRYPPIVKKAVEGADLLINTSWQMPVEEIADFRQHIEESHRGDFNRIGNPHFPLHPDKQPKDCTDYDSGTWFVRLFPVTANLMLTKWAQTPSELVNMVRHISSEPFMALDEPTLFVMTDPNGTHLEGYTVNPTKREGIPGMPYDSWRKDASHYLPIPEWVHPPINCTKINGELYFNCMLPWWSQYIGIEAYWGETIKVIVENSRMVAIEGGIEAKKLVAFLKEMETKVGDKIWLFDTFHFGIHPNAFVTKYECSHDIYRRTIEHSCCNNVHWHIGSAGGRPDYNFYPHITGDIRECTLKVGDKLVYDRGWLCCQDDPRLQEIMKKYPGRPGIPVNPNTLTELKK